jgi:hypothetical protein
LDEIVEHLDLDERLVMEPLLVANDLDGDHVARLVIAALEHLSERALAEDVDDLVAVHDVVMRDEEVVATVVVKAVVVCRVLFGILLLVAVRADKVDLLVLLDLLLLVRREIARVERQSICEGEEWISQQRRERAVMVRTHLARREEGEARLDQGTRTSCELPRARCRRPSSWPAVDAHRPTFPHHHEAPPRQCWAPS